MITDEALIDRIVDYAQGTCLSPSAIAAHFDEVDDDAGDDIEEVLLDANIELCRGCEWWHESGELADDEDHIGYCSDCRPKGDNDG